MTTLLELSDVNYRVAEKTILQSINLTLQEREIVTIVGPNGAGKTSLLSIALGLVKPSSGKVVQHSVNGETLRIGYVPQKVNCDSTLPLSVLEFLLLSKAAKKKSEILSLLKSLNLTKLAKSLLSDLSGGELRRILFVRALLNNPHLLVLDEPTAGIDVAGQEQFYQLINHFREKYGFAILMVSHDLHLVMSATDRVLCLNQHICCQGTPEHVVSNPHYRALFENESVREKQARLSELAFYQHHHDHEHDCCGHVDSENNDNHTNHLKDKSE